MGGGGIKVRNLVLFGRTGNGKSATANTILERKAFKSKRSLSGVTTTAECQGTQFKNQVVNVIDTPGLFDFCVGTEVIAQEIVKCISLAKEGIHAILFVLSIRVRFTEEEEAAVKALQSIFGPKITEYMIVVFTGGDDLEEEEEDDSSQDFLGPDCPQPLQKIIQLCKNRCVVFDNKTKDEEKKASQLETLMTLVENVVAENRGIPYTSNIFDQYKEAELLKQKKEEANASEGSSSCSKQELLELTERLQKSYEEQLKRITEEVGRKVTEASEKLVEELKKEKEARSEAERVARDALEKANAAVWRPCSIM